MITGTSGSTDTTAYATPAVSVGPDVRLSGRSHPDAEAFRHPAASGWASVT
jgi:hypothetical protein